MYGDGYISAFAGTGEAGPPGDGGPALLAVLTNPTSVAVGLDQSVLIGDGTRRVRSVDLAGIIRTLGGTGQDGDAESGTPFNAAPLGLGLQIASDPNGGVCITDDATNKIRSVGADCRLHTLAGTGTAGFSPDRTASLNAELNNPSGPSFGPTGEIYFVSPENRLVRRLARVVRDGGGACVQSLQVEMDRGAVMAQEPLYGFVRFNCPVETDTDVVLGSSHQNLLVPSSVTVPAGKQITFFPVETLAFDDPNLPRYYAETANVTASSGSFEDTTGATLVVWRKKVVERVEVSKPVVIGGHTLSATVWLAQPARLSGVPLSVDADPHVSTHDSVLVQHRMRSVEFLIRTVPVNQREFAWVSVSDPGEERPPVEGPFVIEPTEPNPEGPSLVDLLSLTVTPDTVIGGDGSTARVVLSDPAPAGGAQVFFYTSGSNAVAPESIIVEAGATFADFLIATSPVATAEESIITAISANTVSDALVILPEGGNGGTLLSLGIDPTSVVGGETATGTVVLAEPASLGGVVVTLTSDDPAATIQPSVTVPAEQTSVSFAIETMSVEASTLAGITATATNSAAETLTIQPVSGGPGEGDILSLVVEPDAVTGGDGATGTVTLADPAPVGGILVSLTSDDPAATAAASITIAEGQTTGQFPVATTAVESTTVAEITATSANAVSDALTIQPESTGTGEGEILSLVVEPGTVTGGDGATGTVTLADPAPVGGILVSLTSDDPAATAAASITIAEGQTTGQFPVATTAVESTTVAEITATSANAVSDALTIQPESTGTGEGEILSLVVEPGTVNGGDGATGTVTLAAPAPAGGVLVSLASDDPAATTSASITIGEGQTVGQFAVSTSNVESTTFAEITATSANAVSDALTIQPKSTGPGEGNILSLVIEPDAVTGGDGATGTVTLADPAPAGGILVSLASDDPAATVAASITIAEGQTSGQFPVATTAVESTTVAEITATSANSLSDSLTIQPESGGAGEGEILSLVLDPDTVTGGNSAAGTVTLADPAPVGGILVSLASDDPAATVAASITIGEGQTSAQFGVPTSQVAGPTSAEISATSANSVSAELTINSTPCVSSIQITLQDFLGTVVGGTSLSAVVHLTGPAPVGGLDVALTSALLDVSVPATVHVPAGQLSAGFTITTHAVSSLVSSLVTATVGDCPGVEVTIGVEPPCVASLNLSVSSVVGGDSVLGTVTLTGPAPTGGSEVTLVSSDSELDAPASVLVPEGETSAEFTVNVAAVPTILQSTLQALLGDCPGVQVELDILAPVLESLGVSPSAFPLVGGSTTATVTLSGPAPAGGLAIQLEGSEESIDQGLLSGLLSVVVPDEVVVPEGETSADFDVTASLVGTVLSLLVDHDGFINATLGATVKNVDVVIESLL